MRVISGLAFFSSCVMVILMYQAVRQELNLRSLKTSQTETSTQIKVKEDSIVQIKMKITQMDKDLRSITTQRDVLTKKTTQTAKAIADLDNSLKTCYTKKAESEKKKTAATEAFQKVKAAEEAEKTKALEEIQGLKQRILDRDHKLCTFVDPAIEEGRKLCGIAEAPK